MNDRRMNNRYQGGLMIRCRQQSPAVNAVPRFPWRAAGLAVGIMLLVLPAYTLAASFDCSRAIAYAEKNICEDPELSRLDEKLSSTYKNVIEITPNQKELRSGQLAWIKKRNACKDKSCIKQEYNDRINQLSDVQISLLASDRVNTFEANIIRNDCNKSASKVEKLICEDNELYEFNQALAISYIGLLRSGRSADTINAIKNEQRNWLSSFNNCSDKTCILAAFRMRKEQLESMHKSETGLHGLPEPDTASSYFRLVMSKNQKLCQHMLSLLNEDLKTYSMEQYDAHTEFNQILWKEVRYEIQRMNRIDYGYAKAALFDIKNDGNISFVIKEAGSLGGKPADSLYVLKSDMQTKFDELKSADLFSSDNQISLFGQAYSLQKPFPPILDIRIVVPFIYGDKYYLYMRPLFGVSFIENKKNSQLFRNTRAVSLKTGVLAVCTTNVIWS